MQLAEGMIISVDLFYLRNEFKQQIEINSRIDLRMTMKLRATSIFAAKIYLCVFFHYFMVIIRL